MGSLVFTQSTLDHSKNRAQRSYSNFLWAERLETCSACAKDLARFMVVSAVWLRPCQSALAWMVCVSRGELSDLVEGASLREAARCSRPPSGQSTSPRSLRQDGSQPTRDSREADNLGSSLCWNLTHSRRLVPAGDLVFRGVPWGRLQQTSELPC